MHRIAIEAFRVLRGLPGHEFQYPREARDEREMPGPFDENVFRLRRQRLREALGVIPHEGQVVALRAVHPDRNGHLCERVVGEGGGIRRHEHDGAHTRITDIRNIADLPGGFPRRRTTGGAEPGIVGMLSAVRNAGSGTRLRAGDGQRGVATV